MGLWRPGWRRRREGARLWGLRSMGVGCGCSGVSKSEKQVLRDAQDDNSYLYHLCRRGGGGEVGGAAGFVEDVAHAADLGAYSAELVFEVFVAAVEVVDAVEDGLA